MEDENKQIQTVDPSADIVDTKGASSKLAAMMEFVKQNLSKGNDYMSIGGGKPTLLKSGAEKMNILLGYSAEYHKVKEIINPKDSFYYVEIKCILKNAKANVKVAEGIASCNNKEKSRKHLDFHDALNPVLKIAEKRAYVGATLNANALSQFYTQDLDDDVPTPNKPKAILNCSKCGIDISPKVADYSAKHTGRILCVSCQKG